MNTASLGERAGAVRRFNRFYTRVIGVLDEGLLGTSLGLTEARILFELSHHEDPTAKVLQSELGIDAGYMSRILGRFERLGLIRKTRSAADSRQRLLHLSAKGQRLLAGLETSSQEKFEGLLEALSVEDQCRLIASMRSIEAVLDPGPAMDAPIILRAHRPGDVGWVTERHGVLYRQEFGWDEQFEAVVAQILADFLRNHDPQRERSWIAERDGCRIGSLFLVADDQAVARLRLLLVEPSARGHGLGRALIEEGIRFARQAGYLRIRLWTMDVLEHAHRIYQTSGFVCTDRQPCERFGYSLVAETWELNLEE